MNKEKPQLNSSGRLKEENLTPCDNRRAQQMKKESSSFLGLKDSINEKSWTLYYDPSNFLFLSKKAFSFFRHAGTWTWLTGSQTLNCKSLIIPNKLNFDGKISAVYLLQASSSTVRMNSAAGLDHGIRNPATWVLWLGRNYGSSGISDGKRYYLEFMACSIGKSITNLNS